jgi:thiamine transport system permease protein
MVALFYWPLLNVFNLALGPGINGSVPNEVSVWPVLWFTVWQALVSTAICLVLGIPGAYILYRKSFKGSAFLKSLITVPFMLPSLVVAIAVTEAGSLIGGIEPVAAIIFANVFANYAVVVRNIGSQWQTLDIATEEEAEVGSKIINLHSSGKIVLYVRKTICKCEGQLSDGVRTRFCNVVATNTH